MENLARRTAASKRGVASRLGIGASGGAALALLVIYLTDRLLIAPWLSSLPTDVHGRPESWLVFMAQIVLVPIFVIWAGWLAMGWAQRRWGLDEARPHRATFVLYSCGVLVIALLGLDTLGLEGSLIAASIAIGLVGVLSNSPSQLQRPPRSTLH